MSFCPECAERDFDQGESWYSPYDCTTVVQQPLQALFAQSPEGFALLFGAEINAEAERSRELRMGEPAEEQLTAPAKA